MACQYTGLELSNKRMKNHPEVTKLLDEANKRGVYSVVTAAMTNAKNSGITGLQVVEIGRAAMVNGLQAAAELNAKIRAEQAQRKEERAEAIRFYQKNGYGQTQREDEEDVLADIHAVVEPLYVKPEPQDLTE